MNRLSVDQMMMGIARMAAGRSTCSRLHVGAVIARGPHPISLGYNGAAKGEPHCQHTGAAAEGSCQQSLHAESNALDYAVADVSGCVMYITHSPCAQCAGRLINSGISRVIFGEHYRDNGGIIRLNEAGVQTRRLIDV